MTLPRRITPLAAVLLGLLGFWLLKWLVTSIGEWSGGGAAGTHAALKLALAIVSLAISCLHPAGLGLLGMRRPRGFGWLGIGFAGAIIGAAATFLLLAARAGGHPLLQQLSFLQIVLSVWLLSSFAEELYCRGLAQPWIDDSDDRYWTHPASIASALLFGGMHAGLYFDGADARATAILVGATTVLGWLCAAARRMSGSVWPAIVTHLAFNVGGVGGAIVAVVAFGPGVLPN